MDFETHPVGTAARLAKLERSLKIYEAESTRFRHANPEYTGAFFISGAGGTVDKHLLPEYVTICPAYGADWSITYRKDKQ